MPLLFKPDETIFTSKDNRTMIDIIIALLGALTGGGLTGVFYWRANRRKADGEATQTEADAMKTVQEVYKQALTDAQDCISQLRDTRDHLIADRNEMRDENNELRKRLNEMEEKVQQLERDMIRNNRMMASLRPFLCGRINCPDHIEVNLVESDSGEEPIISAHPHRTHKASKK